MKCNNFGLVAAAAVACLLGAADAQALGTISYVGKTSDITDFQAAGMGAAGFWFAQFDAAGPVTNAPADDNDRNALPSWILPDFDPNSAGYSFGDLVYSEGGNTGWNSFTLPNGMSGLSGSLVDPEAANNSNNTIPRLAFGAGLPASFLFHVVVDNTNNAYDSANRIRARGEDATGADTDNRVNLTAADFNAVADVYTFRYDGWAPGDFIKLQLNSGQAGIPAGVAGFMFDAIPEPTSVVLLALALAPVGAMRRRTA